MNLSLLIPSYRGGNRLPELLSRLEALLESPGFRGSEVILVDDGSDDGSWELIRTEAQRLPWLRAFRLSSNCGQQMASLFGLSRCRGEWIATLDDDLEHPPEELFELLPFREAGYELIFGVRRVGYSSPVRRLGSVLRNLVFRGVRVSSFRLISASLARKLLQGPCPYPYLSAMALQYHPRTLSVELPPVPRRAGRQNRLRLAATLLSLGRAYLLPSGRKSPPVSLPKAAETAGALR
jgi:undecaprenyl-phosphate 4-deoxy-4-formamido-L-arabinose transferase